MPVKAVRFAVKNMSARAPVKPRQSRQGSIRLLHTAKFKDGATELDHKYRDSARNIGDLDTGTTAGTFR